MTCCGRNKIGSTCDSLNPNSRGFATVRNGGIGGFDPCPGLPCCMPSFRPPPCADRPRSYGPICIPLGYPCPCQPCPKPTCGQNNQSSWRAAGQCGQERTQLQVNFNYEGSGPKTGYPIPHSQPNYPSRCGPCGRTGHSSYIAPCPNRDDCDVVKSPCPRPLIAYSDGCSPPPCKPCCSPPCCNPLPPCCIAIQPCLPKCCPSRSCKRPDYCCPNACTPQPDPRCCPKPMILNFVCPQRRVPNCPNRPCSCD